MILPRRDTIDVRKQRNSDTDRIDFDALGRLLNDLFDITPQNFHFVPEGEESVSYRVETAVSPFFLKLYTHWQGRHLEEKLYLTHHLHTARDFEFVCAPLKGNDGKLLYPFQQYQLALFPYIDGEPIGTPFGIPQQFERSVAAHLAHVHDALYTTSFLPPMPPVAEIDVPFAAELRTLLAAVERQDEATLSELQQKAQQLVLAERDRLNEELERTEYLAQQLQGKYFGSVLSHGDLNGRNILQDKNGRLHIIDWTMCQAAPAERDLIWFVRGGEAGFLRPYLRLRMPDAQLNSQLFEFYLRADRLAVILDAVNALFDITKSADKAYQWQQLTHFLPLRAEAVEKTVQTVAALLN